VLPEQWDAAGAAVDLFDIKSDVAALVSLTGAVDQFEFRPAEHPALRPGRSAELLREGNRIGYLGEMHPALIRKLDVSATPVLFEIATEALLTAVKADYRGISKYPIVRRDLSVVVEADAPVADIVMAVRGAGGPNLRDVIVFDIYAGNKVETGSKSVALGLILQETSRTLTDTDVDKIMHSVVERLSRDFNATIRE
jgi:phenylalanyl-tRNA synthetase beta chain